MSTLRMHWNLTFFNRDIIRTNWRAINQNPMTRAGLLVRRIARNSIRHTPNRQTPPNPPGGFPRSRAASRPFKLIFSVPKITGTGVLVGMVGFNSEGRPGWHEHGGSGRVLQPVWGWRMVRSRHGGFFRTRRLLAMRPVVAHYPARPFMYPALRRARPQIPGFWRNALTRVRGGP